MANEQSIKQIREAIRKATRTVPAVRVINQRPKFRYLYKCYRCGGRNHSLVHVTGHWGDDPVPVCSLCGSMGDGQATWERELERRRRRKYFLASKNDYYCRD